MINNNGAADLGGAVVLDDSVTRPLVNNTVANNVSTGSSEDSDGNPHSAGLASEANDPPCCDAACPPARRGLLPAGGAVQQRLLEQRRVHAQPAGPGATLVDRGLHRLRGPRHDERHRHLHAAVLRPHQRPEPGPGRGAPTGARPAGQHHRRQPRLRHAVRERARRLRVATRPADGRGHDHRPGPAGRADRQLPPRRGVAGGRPRRALLEHPGPGEPHRLALRAAASEARPAAVGPRLDRRRDIDGDFRPMLRTSRRHHAVGPGRRRAARGAGPADRPTTPTRGGRDGPSPRHQPRELPQGVGAGAAGPAGGRRRGRRAGTGAVAPPRPPPPGCPWWPPTGTSASRVGRATRSTSSGSSRSTRRSRSRS